MRICGAGGNSGLGKETARCLAAAGADVTLTARSAQAGDDVAAELQATGVKVSTNVACVPHGRIQHMLQAADAGEHVCGVHDRTCQRPYTQSSTAARSWMRIIEFSPPRAASACSSWIWRTWPACGRLRRRCSA